MHAPHSRALRILHVLRAPVGGLFRHVCDLSTGQAQRGHQVGVIADSGTGGAAAEAAFASLEGHLRLGVHRIPMTRDVGLRDLIGLPQIFRTIRAAEPDILHGHGAKGGAWARLAPLRAAAVRAYTPHGGALHYRPDTLLGKFYGGLERLLMPRTDLFLFESAYARATYLEQVGTPPGIVRVVYNGVNDGEFAPVAFDADATDLLFIGELRALKGVDVLLEALSLVRRRGTPASLTIVGEGPDEAALRAHAGRLGLADLTRFAGYLPARTALTLGRILVVASRNESFPYVVLEAAAAGIPVVATRVGGVPEIFGPQAHRLVPPGDAEALAAAITLALRDPDGLRSAAAAMRERVHRLYSFDSMVGGVLDGYRDAMSHRILSRQ